MFILITWHQNYEKHRVHPKGILNHSLVYVHYYVNSICLMWMNHLFYKMMGMRMMMNILSMNDSWRSIHTLGNTELVCRKTGINKIKLKENRTHNPDTWFWSLKKCVQFSSKELNLHCTDNNCTCHIAPKYMAQTSYCNHCTSWYIWNNLLMNTFEFIFYCRWFYAIYFLKHMNCTDSLMKLSCIIWYYEFLGINR